MMEPHLVNGYVQHSPPQYFVDPSEAYAIVHHLERKISNNAEYGRPNVLHNPKEQWNANVLLMRKAWVESPSMTASYSNEWYRLFGELTAHHSHHQRPVDLTQLRECAFDGQLRNCRFRSVCWRLHLGILQPDMRQWSMDITRERRKFQEIDYMVNLDPHISNFRDHPLSVEQCSRWYQYFDRREIKRLIAQDVDRAFPEVEYFRSPKVQNAMVNVLYCYVKHTGTCYKQGMHELLAPLIFVLHCDQVAFQHACETNAVPAQLKAYLDMLLSDRYLEADAFVLFRRIMHFVQSWYTTDQTSPVQSRPSVADDGKFTDVPRLFSTTSDCVKQDNHVNFNPGVTFVEQIHNRLLQKYNPKVHNHLKQLDIYPALFGLRWIRLLFGQEYPLQDLLYVWDCIFAANDNFALVQYIYVSMLDYLGPSLLNMGYSDCLSHLMRFPQDVDVSYLVQTALHFYHPKQYARPVNIQSPKPAAPANANDLSVVLYQKRRASLAGFDQAGRFGLGKSATAAAATAATATAAAIVSMARKKSASQRNPLLNIQMSPGLDAEQRETSKSTMSLNHLSYKDQSGFSTPNRILSVSRKYEQKLGSNELHARCHEVIGTCLNHVSSVLEEFESEVNNRSSGSTPVDQNSLFEAGKGGIRLHQLERLQLVRSELEKVDRWLSLSAEPPISSPKTEIENPKRRSIRRADSLNILPAIRRPKSAQPMPVEQTNGWSKKSANPGAMPQLNRPQTALPQECKFTVVVPMKLIRKCKLPTAPGLQASALYTPLEILVHSG